MSKKDSGDLITDLFQAKKIMGKNMFGVEDVIKHFGVTLRALSVEQRARLTTIPFSKLVLQECEDTHILFPGYPLTIIEISDTVPRGLFLSYADDWYHNQDFAKKKKVACRWYLIKKNGIPESFGKTFNDGEKLLVENEEIPYACEVIFMVILHKLVTGECLFSNSYVRCHDLTLRGDRLHVGGFSPEGLYFSTLHDHPGRENLGITASRLPHR